MRSVFSRIFVFVVVAPALTSEHVANNSSHTEETVLHLIRSPQFQNDDTVKTTEALANASVVNVVVENEVGDDVVEAVREFESELEAEVLREERESGAIADAKLSQLAHSAAVTVLSSRQNPHWSLLGALSKSFESARSRNAARIESFVTKAINATLSSFSFEDDDPRKAEADAVTAWRQRLALDDGKEVDPRGLALAEQNLIGALRNGALRTAYVSSARKAIDAKMPPLPATNDTIREALAEATKAAELEIAALFSTSDGDGKEGDVRKAAEVAREAAASAELAWRDLNQRAIEEAGQRKLKTALDELRKCLANVPDEAKIGTGHPGSVTLCEADASMQWLEVDEPIQSTFRDSHRRQASSIVGEMRRASLDVGAKIRTALNVSHSRLDDVFDAACSTSRLILPVDEVVLDRCAAPAMEIVDGARKAAIESAPSEHEAIVVESARPLYDYVESHLKKLRDKNARASAKCVQEAFATYSVQVSEYVELMRTNPYQQKHMPPPTPKLCAGPAATADHANFDHLAHSIRRAREEADAALRITSYQATLAIYLASALKLLVMLFRRLPKINVLVSLLLIAVVGLSFLYADLITDHEYPSTPPLPLVVPVAIILLDLCCCCRRRTRRSKRGGAASRSGGGRQSSVLGMSSFGVGREDDHIA